jgi:uncharacterized membrane protein
MNEKTYTNRKTLFFIGITLLIIGGFAAFNFWSFEPQETISGVLCGIGFSSVLISFGLKKSIQ